jgi:hypothetical protein
MNNKKRHIAIDLDKTLANYNSKWGIIHDIGEPIPKMLNRLKEWINEGVKVTIFTARVGHDNIELNKSQTIKIQNWLEKHGLPRLDVTANKSHTFTEIWDDKAISVNENDGRAVRYKNNNIESI